MHLVSIFYRKNSFATLWYVRMARKIHERLSAVFRVSYGISLWLRNIKRGNEYKLLPYHNNDITRTSEITDNSIVWSIHCADFQERKLQTRHHWTSQTPIKPTAFPCSDVIMDANNTVIQIGYLKNEWEPTSDGRRRLQNYYTVVSERCLIMKVAVLGSLSIWNKICTDEIKNSC